VLATEANQSRFNGLAGLTEARRMAKTVKTVFVVGPLPNTRLKPGVNEIFPPRLCAFALIKKDRT
jgi:hypothetical protein